MKFYASIFTVTLIATGLIFTHMSSHRRGPASLSKEEKSTRKIPLYNYKRSFITLNDNIPYKGLTLEDGKDSIYVKKLFGKLIQEADRLAREDFYKPEIGVFKNYFTFLLTSLQVPFHESSLTHFVKRDDSYCYLTNHFLNKETLQGRGIREHLDFEISNLRKEIEIAKEKGESTEGHNSLLKRYLGWKKVSGANSIIGYLDDNITAFYKAYGRGDDIFWSCEKHLFEQDVIQQMLFSNDYADIGMFMLNAKSHSQVFASGDIFDVDKVISYGLSYLYSGHKNSGGFYNIAKNSEGFSCLQGLEESNPSEYAKRLIRGVWSGQYNSGNLSNTCRFMNPSHTWARNDQAYFKNFRRIFDKNLSEGSLWHGYLPAGSIEEKAFLELIDNVENQKNSYNFIGKVLLTDYDSEDSVVVDNSVEDQVIEDVVDIIEDDVDQGVSVVLSDIRTDAVDQVVTDATGQLTNDSQVQANDSIQDVGNIDDDQIVDSSDIGKVEDDKPTDIIGDLPQRVTEKEYIISGSNINIRSAPVAKGNRTVCGNTRLYKGESALKVIKVGDDVKNFAKVKSSNIKSLLFSKRCSQLEYLYIYSDYVKEIEVASTTDQSDEVTSQVINEEKRIAILPYQIVTRLSPSIKGKKTNETVGPGEVEITGEKNYSGKYFWYEFLDHDGVKKWFYAGENGTRVKFK